MRAAFRGFVSVGDRQLYAEHFPPREGRGTLIVLNGLAESTTGWAEFLAPLHAEGYGSLGFDFRGQGLSLRREIEVHGSFEAMVSADDQADDLLALISRFSVPEPLDVVATSYGGGIALNLAARQPARFGKLILLAPYLIRLDQAFPLQRAWMQQLHAMKRLGTPANQVFDAAQRWYHHLLTHYMDHRFYGAVPDPVARQASIRLTFGILGFNGFELLPRLRPLSLHLVTAGRDTLVPRNLYSEMWSKLPHDAAESWLLVEDGEHQLVEQFPMLLTRWTELALGSRVGGRKRYRALGDSFEAWDEGGAKVPLRPRTRSEDSRASAQ